MSATVIQFQPYQYDPLLEGTRTQVLEALRDDPSECRKIASCKGSSLRCHSIYCPSCLRGRAYKEKGRILAACDGVGSNQLRFGTFKSKDVPLDYLRYTGGVLMEAGRTALKRLKVDGFAQRLEVSFEDWHDGYHPHLHAIVDTPLGGRGFIPRAAFEQEWLRALPHDLHPLENPTHVAPVRDVEESCAYITKSVFSQQMETARVSRTVDSLRTLKGIARTAIRGSMIAGECTAQLPAAA